MLADTATGDLIPRAPDLLAALEERSSLERYTVTGELLTNTVEVTSGIGDTVAAAVDDIADAIAEVRTYTDPHGIDLLCAGSHPFAQWYDQSVTDKTRYHKLIERTQWWGRNMMIWGIHIHVGVDDVNKVFPIINALAVYLPHLQALSASSPFWAGERTGYASNRALVFQQLPTAGLPWPLQDWSEFEGYLDDMVAHRSDGGCHRGAMGHPPGAPLGHHRGARVRRDVDASRARRPRGPGAGARGALLARLDEGLPLETIQPWFIRENKWRAARYGLDARVIVDHLGTQRLVAEHLRETLAEIGGIADDLKCARELAGIETILTDGASYSRQLAVADASDGDLRAVVRHLVGEFRSGPTLREHLATLGR